MTSTTATVERPPLVFAPMVRLARVLWRLLPYLALACIAVAGVTLCDTPQHVVHQVLLGVGVVLAFGLARALIAEIFSPDRAELRLVPVTDVHARRLAATLRAVLFFLLLTGLGIHLIGANGWHDDVADLLRIVRDVVLILAGAALLSGTGLLRWMRTRTGESWLAAVSRYVARVLVPLSLLTLLFVVVVNRLGYVPLSEWVAGNAAWTALKLLVAMLAYRWLRRALTRLVRFYREDRQPGVEDGSVAHLENDAVALGVLRLGGGLLKLGIIVGTGFWLLETWDLSAGALLGILDAPIFGGEGLTWGELAGGFLSVAAVLLAGWFLRNLLTFFIFPRSSVSVGARYAILAVLRYVVIALALVFTLGALGVDTSSMSWFFGAAGIGLAFGLQDIVGNFISGLIMLVEQPIRVGDIVKIGETSGTVENIHMRGTVLRTFDNTTVLIPNSQLLGERVTNLTHNMGHTRLLVPVGVAYDSDPAVVETLLREAAAAHPEVVADPAPKVLFQDFGPSSLDFTLACYTDQLASRVGIASQLRLSILEKLQKAGIEIPYPQQDLHIRSSSLPPPGPPEADSGTEGANRA